MNENKLHRPTQRNYAAQLNSTLLNSILRNSTQLNVHQLRRPTNISDGLTSNIHADDHRSVTELLAATSAPLTTSNTANCSNAWKFRLIQHYAQQLFGC